MKKVKPRKVKFIYLPMRGCIRYKVDINNKVVYRQDRTIPLNGWLPSHPKWQEVKDLNKLEEALDINLFKMGVEL